MQTIYFGKKSELLCALESAVAKGGGVILKHRHSNFEIEVREGIPPEYEGRKPTLKEYGCVPSDACYPPEYHKAIEHWATSRGIKSKIGRVKKSPMSLWCKR